MVPEVAVKTPALAGVAAYHIALPEEALPVDPVKVISCSVSFLM